MTVMRSCSAPVSRNSAASFRCRAAYSFSYCCARASDNSPFSFCRRVSSATRSSTSSFSSFPITFALCNGRTSDLEKAELDLVAVLVDRLDLDDHPVAEPHLAAGRLPAQAVLALAELPVIAADSRHRHHPLHEDFVQLDEDAERGDAGDDAGE